MSSLVVGWLLMNGESGVPLTKSLVISSRVEVEYTRGLENS